MHKVVHKPWGKEEWLELNDSYCYKRIYINAGYKTSFQYHKFKRETNYIIEGRAEVWLEDDQGVVQKKIMTAGDFFNVTPPKKHRVIAITDIILQEVSTPQVDDVYRLNDEFNRSDGKIDEEHNTPAVLILSAGLGSRLNNLTKFVNKSLLPINNEAIISKIIKKFPQNYDFVVTLGYKGDILKEFLELTFPHINFIFVEVENFDDPSSGPGTTAIKCKEHLNRPFYFVVSDCVIDSDLPHLDGNWLAVQETAFPEKYSTLEIDASNNILNFKEKSSDGYSNAFTGLASIWDFKTFWSELENNMVNGEIVSAFNDLKKYKSFKAKKVKWFDTGNLDDLNSTKKYFNDKPLSLEKNTGEILFKSDSLIKFNPNPNSIQNLSLRAIQLKDLVPVNFQSTTNFIKYDWINGKTLYETNKFKEYKNFLLFFEGIIKSAKFKDISNQNIEDFYLEKTNSRLKLFLDKKGEAYLNQAYVVNGTKYPPLKEFVSGLTIDKFKLSKGYNLFHGDLQFDNIIIENKTSNFYYIDWRESFANNTDYGDFYYDLAKLYGGLIINYYEAKEKNYFTFEKGESIVNYSIPVNNEIKEFKEFYENWLNSQGYDINYIRFLTGIIFLNMSPLHEEDFGEVLWFKAIELLS